MMQTTTMPMGGNLMKYFFVLFILSLAFQSTSQEIPSDLVLPEEYQQLILVTTNGWDDIGGNLTMFSRNEADWVKVNTSPVKVVVGKNGLAWGQGLHQLPKAESMKREGDGRAPAGIFALGDAFGYNEKPDEIQNWNYRKATERDYFIDDVDAGDYNSWQYISEKEINNPKKKWRSFERMKRSDHLYELGLVVNHNTSPTVKGMGSAIFLHIWRGENSPTLGCTAMKKEDLFGLITWIDSDKNPLLIQAPSDTINLLKFK